MLMSHRAVQWRIWMTRRQRSLLTGLGIAGLVWLAADGWQARHPLRAAKAPPEAAGWSAQLAAARTVDLNAAGAAELERLPGIGPGLAGRIVAHRSMRGAFRAPEELLEVPGIGPATYERLQDRITVR